MVPQKDARNEAPASPDAQGTELAQVREVAKSQLQLLKADIERKKNNASEEKKAIFEEALQNVEKVLSNIEYASQEQIQKIVTSLREIGNIEIENPGADAVMIEGLTTMFHPHTTEATTQEGQVAESLPGFSGKFQEVVDKAMKIFEQLKAQIANMDAGTLSMIAGFLSGSPAIANFLKEVMNSNPSLLLMIRKKIKNLTPEAGEQLMEILQQQYATVTAVVPAAGDFYTFVKKVLDATAPSATVEQMKATAVKVADTMKLQAPGKPAAPQDPAVEVQATATSEVKESATKSLFTTHGSIDAVVVGRAPGNTLTVQSHSKIAKITTLVPNQTITTIETLEASQAQPNAQIIVTLGNDEKLVFNAKDFFTSAATAQVNSTTTIKTVDAKDFQIEFTSAA